MQEFNKQPAAAERDKAEAATAEGGRMTRSDGGSGAEAGGLRLTLHDAALLEPPLPGPLIDLIGDAFLERGELDLPIIVTLDNRIIFGRSAHEALQRRGIVVVEAMLKRVDISDAAAFEMAARLNLDRGDMSKSQRTMYVADLIRGLRTRSNNEVSVAAAAARYCVSKKNVENAQRLREKDSELAEWVKNGALTVNAGLVLAKPDKLDQRSQVVAWLQAGDKKAVAKLLNANKARSKPASKGTEGVTAFGELFEVLRRLPKLPLHMMQLTERIRSGAMVVGEGVQARRMKAAIEANFLRSNGVTEAAQALIEAIDFQLSAISEKSGRASADAAE